jgi:hypothetical protein
MRQSAENQTFLHTRFGLGEDPLEPDKEKIQHWIAPQITRRDADVSISKARQAIASYRKPLARGPGCWN